jgi:hypothetical protein
MKVKQIGTGSIGPPIKGDDAFRAYGLADDDGTGTVSKKYAGVAVSPIDDGGEALSSYHENISSSTRA